MKKEKSFFMVFVEGENTPSFKHEHPQDAEREAKRLANLTRKPAFVLKSVRRIEKLEYITTDMDFDEIPF